MTIVDQLLNQVQVEHRREVSETAQRLTAAMRARAPKRAAAQPGLYELQPTTTAIIAPDLGDTRLELLSRYGLWTARLDDALDDPAVSPAERALIGSTIHNTLMRQPAFVGRGAREAAALAYELADIMASLDQLDVDQVVVDRFIVALREAVRAEIARADTGRQVAAGQRPAPSVREYLTLGRHDIQYRSFALLLLALVDERPPVELLDRWDEALAGASVAVRVANDLRSLDRDRAGHALNVVGLLTDRGDVMTPDLAAGWVADSARSYLLTLTEYRSAQYSASITALTNCIRVALALYAVGDLR